MQNMMMVALRDGSQVLEAKVVKTLENIKAAYHENSLALIDLLEKCKKVEYKIVDSSFVASKTILRKLSLIKSDGSVDEDIKKIAVNSIEWEEFMVKIVNPFQSKKTIVIANRNK